MKIWVATFLLFSGVIKFSSGQDSPDHDFETFKDYNGPPSEAYFPALFDVSESTYLAEDDGDNRRSFKVVDAKPRITRSFLYVAPEDVEDSLVRDKRDAPDYDYTKSYRDFVRENFGLDEVKSFADDDDSDDSEYERIKELSQKEAEESRKHPEFCKIVRRGDKECTICKNPKTNAQSETCSYSSHPKPKKYAYKRERNYNSKDEDDDDYDHEEEASEKDERKTPKQKQKKSRKQAPAQEHSGYEEDGAHVIVKLNKKSKSKKQVPRQAEEYSKDQVFKPSQPYVTGAVGRKVDQVLEEFKKRDWSKCKRKSKDGLTCYYCKDAKGASQEECMYISDDSSEATPHRKDIEDYDDTPKNDTKKVTTRTPRRQRQSQAAARRSQNTAPEPENSDSNPTEKRTIKRMVSVKIHENGDSDPAANKEVFYKKICSS